MAMKRMSILVILGAVLVLAARSEAAAPMVATPETQLLATASTVADGTTLMIVDTDPQPILKWNPVCGFHYGKCNRMKESGRGFKVWAQRFSGFDATQGRPLYARARF